MFEENKENETPKNEGGEQPIVQEETAEETPKTDSEVLNEEQVEELKKRAKLTESYKIRAEKAEGELKKKKSVKEELTMTPKDTVALVNAKVDTEDFDSVVDWAKFKGVSVSDALKDKTLQVVLREKGEERKTAQATSTKGGRSFSKETPEEIVSRASKGELPDDDEGIAKLAEAHMKLRLKKLQ
jgi:hypothetical protein